MRSQMSPYFLTSSLFWSSPMNADGLKNKRVSKTCRLIYEYIFTTDQLLDRFSLYRSQTIELKRLQILSQAATKTAMFQLHLIYARFVHAKNVQATLRLDKTNNSQFARPVAFSGGGGGSHFPEQRLVIEPRINVMEYFSFSYPGSPSVPLCSF